MSATRPPWRPSTGPQSPLKGTHEGPRAPSGARVKTWQAPKIPPQWARATVELSIASGWHPNDFVFAPQNYAKRYEVMKEGIDTFFDKEDQ